MDCTDLGRGRLVVRLAAAGEEMAGVQAGESGQR